MICVADLVDDEHQWRVVSHRVDRSQRPTSSQLEHPSLSVLVGWCRLAGLVHTVPLSLAGELEGYLTTELLPTGPLLWQPGGSSTPGLCQSLPLTQKVRRPDA